MPSKNVSTSADFGEHEIATADDDDDDDDDDVDADADVDVDADADADDVDIDVDLYISILSISMYQCCSRRSKLKSIDLNHTQSEKLIPLG